MSLSKKELKNIKNKINQSNPGVIANIRKRVKVVAVSDNLDDTSHKHSHTKPKNVLRWNFNVNDLVEVRGSIYDSTTSKQIGLIVSDYIYHTSKVEKNSFFVLVENIVKELSGKYLRKVWLTSVIMIKIIVWYIVNTIPHILKEIKWNLT